MNNLKNSERDVNTRYKDKMLFLEVYSGYEGNYDQCKKSFYNLKHCNLITNNPHLVY